MKICENFSSFEVLVLLKTVLIQEQKNATFLENMYTA